METDPRLRRLQLVELDILTEFVRICDKYGLRYYLVGGTLLGAIRHQGFIPWDDDIDVAMMREDYDRFAQIAAQELDPRYFYQSPDTDPYYFLTYNKIRKNGTEVYEERFKDSKFHKGIFIDIFPLDFCPKPGPVCHLLFNVLAVMNYRGQVDSGEAYRPYDERSGKIGYTVLHLFTAKRLVKTRRLLLWLSKQISCGKYIASFSGAYGYSKEVLPWDWFRETGSLLFENKEYQVPQMCCHVLAQIYGNDYEKTPLKGSQKGHCVLERIRFLP